MRQNDMMRNIFAPNSPLSNGGRGRKCRCWPGIWLNAGSGHGQEFLEIGSFVGGFLLEGQKQGWDMVGVDPGHDVAAFCRERGLPVFEGTLEEARFTPASFDAVVVWNTFDQLPDPRALLEQAVLLLRNGGVLVLRVPNGACFAWMLRMRSAPSLEASTTRSTWRWPATIS